jgi:hypothetical protein
MKLKDSIKKKVDQLAPHELRIVENFIDSLSGTSATNAENEGEPPYLKVRELLKNTKLSSSDISNLREERI